MTEPDQTVVLVRHGETEWSRTGQHTGRTDIPLTETGRRQASAAAPALADHRFALVLVSPLQRAQETARLAGLGDCAVACGDLVEWDYGDTEGLTTAQIRERRPGWVLWRDGVDTGETVDDVGERADRVIERVRAVVGDVALVAHGHLLRVLAARWLGLKAVEGRLFALDTASISELGYEHGIAVIRRWNDLGHLRGA